VDPEAQVVNERWQANVMQLMNLAKSLADQHQHDPQSQLELVPELDPEAQREADVFAHGIGLLGAALIRLCKLHSREPIGALDIAIEGLQQARALMSARRPRGARS
jgi:hypothetical protein